MNTSSGASRHLPLKGKAWVAISYVEDDATRDEYLKKIGLVVKRYANNEINKDFESVCMDIYQFIFPDEK